MAKTYKVIVNSGKEKADPTIEVVQGAGDRGQPVRIKAQAGAKYQLQELDRKKQVAPDGVKVKRVGKDLWVLFEEESQPSLILEDYYDVMPEGHNGVVGQAEDGLFYEYIPEDPKVSGLVSELAQGGQAVNVALGGVEVSGVGAAVGAVAFPWLGALGVLAGVAGAGALAYQALKKDGTGNQAGDLASASDSGQSNTDNLTNNKTNLVVQGQATPGSTVDVLVKNSSGVVVYQGKVTADADGNFNYTVPGPLPDGVYTPYTGETQGKPFTIDTVTNVDITDPGRVGTLSPISGTAEPGGTVVVKDANGKVVGTVVANAQGVWQITPTTPVPAGAVTAEVTDPAGNKANDSDMPVGLGVKTALSLDPISGDNILLASESGVTTLPVTGKVTGTFTAGDVVNVTLNGKNYAALVGADGRFSVPVSMADLKADPDTKIEATITGTNGDNATAAQDYTVEAGNTPAQTALSVDPVTSDNVLSASERLANVPITGQATGKFTAGDTVTLSVNGKTFTGTVAADGKFSINVPAADLAADPDTKLEARLSGTGGVTAQAIQDYALDTTTPTGVKTALSLDLISGDNVLLASESGATTLPVTGKVTGTFTAGDVVNLTLNGKNYSASVAADGSFSVPVAMADLKADSDTKIEARITGTNGDIATAAQDYTVEAGNTPTQTALSLDPVTADNVLSPAEAIGSVAITGQATGKFATGDTVTLSVNGKTFTGSVAADGKFSINVPGADLDADSDTQIEARITGTGGTAATAFEDYALSSASGGGSNPVLPPSGDLAPGSDSGVPGDGITNDTTPTIIGQVPAGSTATITLNGKTYPVDVKPDGSYTFTQPDGLPDGTYTPVLNVTRNGQTTSTPIYPFTIDTVPPSVAISADKIQLLAGQTSTITFILSEEVSDFSAADITVSGGTLANLVQSQTDPKVYTAVFTPNASSTTTSVISVASGRFSDAANNFNTDGAEANNTLNLPTNTQTPGGTIFLAPSSDSGAPGDNRTNDNTPTMTGQVPVGSTAVVSINGRDYPVSVKPDGSYTFTVPTGLPDGTYVPKIIITPAGSSTPNSPQDGTPFTIDTVPPTVLVSSDKATLATGQTATITFTLSEDSSDFTLADVTATGGTLSNLQGSGKSYTATFTPSAGSTATSTVKVDSFKFSDAAGNFNTDGSDTGVGNTNIVSMPTNTAQADTTAPTIALSADRTSLATGQTTVVTFTLSEASSDFTLADVTATGGTLANLVQSQTDPKIYTAVFTPNASSTTPSVISVASNKFSDAAGNQNTDGADANNTLSLPTNTTPAQTSGQLQPSSDSGTQGDNKTLDNTPAYGGTAPAGSQVEVVINGKTYTTVADSKGQYTVVVPDALPDGTYVPKIIVTPAGSNTPNAPQDGTPFTIDTTPPMVVVSSDKATLAAGQTATITFTLNEASSDFTLADVQVSGGTLSNFQGSGTSYTATFTPNAGSTAPSVVHVASNKFADAAGNLNTDGAQSNNTVSMVTNTMPPEAPGHDTTAPTVIVTRSNPGASLAANASETINFTLSEPSGTFGLNDVTVTGGTLSNFTAIPSSGTAGTGYTQYTATFTPAAGSAGTATVGVAASTFSDNAGNLNADTFVQGTGYQSDNQVSLAYNTVPADTTPPTVAVSRAGSGSLTQGGFETITFVLSEASTTFNLSDIDVSGGTLSNFAPLTTSGNASTGYTDYTATFTPNANALGTATIGVASGRFTDVSNNANLDTYLTGVAGTSLEANNLVNINYNTQLPDTTAPTIIVSRASAGTVSGTETVYFTLSEASTSFALSDVDVTGGNLSNFVPVATSGNNSQGYTQYMATFTPTANAQGNATIGVASAKFSDAAGNLNADTYVSGAGYETNNLVSLAFNTLVPDTTAPSIAISRTGSGLVTGTETVSFTLSEASSNFTLADIDVTGGTLSNFQPVSSSGSVSLGYTEYTATFTPTANTLGTGSVGVLSGKFTDAASNANTDTYVSGVASTTQEGNNLVGFAINTDTTAPTVTVSRTSSGTVTGTETINFTLSEASTDFALADIAVTSGTLSNFQGSGTSYSATFTPTAGSLGTATIGVLSAKFADAAGNLNKDTFANPASGSDVYEANNLVSLPVNTDSTAPTIVVARAGTGTLNSSETISFTLSEASSSFDASDVVVSGGTLSNLAPVSSSGNSTSGYTQYTATFTPTANSTGTATVGVASDKFADAAGNLNKDTYLAGVTGTTQEANNQVSMAYNTQAPDTTTPTVVVSRSGAGFVNGSEVINFTLSEASTDFSLADITVSGGTLSNFTGSGSTYSATFTPTANAVGTGTVGVASNTFADAAGNRNLDTFVAGNVAGTVTESNNQVNLPYNTDTTAPTVIVARTGSGTVSSTGETIRFTLSEASSNFALSDIDVTGGTLSNWVQDSTNPLIYTALFMPSANGVGVATVGVASNKFSDAAGNFNADTYLTGVSNTTVESNNQVSFNYSNDSAPPSIAISSNQASLAAGQTATITFTLSEASSDFTAADIETSGGSLGTLTRVGVNSSGQDVYTATFTPTANSTTPGVVRVASDKFSDAAGNLNKDTYAASVSGTTQEANNSVSLTVNTTVVSGLTLSNDSATAKEAGVQNGGNTAEAGTNPSTTTQSAGVLGNDTAATSVTQIAVSGGSNSAVSSGSTGASGGTTVTGQYGTLVMGANGTYTYTLSNTNGTVNALQAGSSLSDVFTYTATDGTTPKTANLTVTINGTNDAPTVALPLEDRTGIEIGNSVNYTFDSGTFADVDTADTKSYTATMADGSALPNWLTFNATTRNFSGTPPAVGTYAVKVIATDSRGATTSDEFIIDVIASRNVVIDDIPPTVVVGRAGSGTLSGTETITFTLSENASDFTQADVFVTSGAGALSNWTAVSGTVYTATFTPTANSAGNVTIGVRADKFSDAAGNQNDDDYTLTGGANSNAENNNNAVTFAYKTDNTAPTIAITGPSGAVSGPSTITFTLSEVSSDFVWDGSAGDIVVTGGGTLSAITASSTPGVWTATYTPPSGAGTGTATISVASNKFSDAAGNFNTDGADANNSLSVNFDTVAPTVAVSRATNVTLGSTGATAATETITFTLSEASTDFTEADVLLSAGALTGWTAVSSTVYTATFTPPTGANAAIGTATIGVKAGKFQDAAGNQNADDFALTGGANSNAENANNQVSVAYDTVVPTQTVSFSSMTKDSGLSSGNANWTTADASAGRLLSGFISAPLGSGETVQVWAKKDSGAAVLLGTATVDAGGTTWEYTDTTSYVGATGAASNAAGWTYSAKVVDAVGNSAPTASREVTLEAAASGTSGATSAANQLTYAASDTVHALDGNDTITVTASTLQSDLTSAGFINGGAGIDTLKLAAGTTINLQTLTSNQTVQKLQEVEIIQMQGSNSSLTLSANNVLSLGGANASTMTPFTFSSTTQVADGGTAATGSTSSSGKVQMVIQGISTDTLKLDALATDGVSSSAGVLGNSGLTGSWAYKGQVQIGTVSYKVYDHSTTNAQVLVDVPVVVTTVSPIAITAIDDANGSSTTANGSKDTGTSASDFITSDTTLVYRGTVPVEYNDTNHDVFVEILNSGGTVVQSGTATVSGSNWTLDQTGSPLAAGNYTIRSTIVGQGNTTAVSSFGSQGVDTQPMVIDTTAPTIVVARAGTGTLAAGQTETITFTLSEASSNFASDDITVTGGTLTNFSGSGTSYSATFTPTGNTSSTGSISVASAKFSDAAGNQNADGAEANNTASVPYVTSTPTQTVTFSSMTKDTGLTTVTTNNTSSNANWTTADGSAGRLVSGSVSAALNAGEVVEVYVNKMDGAGAVKIGNATTTGTHWAVTDHTSYVANAAWVYSAKVVDAAGNAGATQTRNVFSDYVEAAPVITAVIDSANTTVATNTSVTGTTTNSLKTVSGTGTIGSTIYVYDNSQTNLVGTAVVDGSGNWTATITGVGAGANNFAALALDNVGNTSVLSNLVTVTAAASNGFSNGDFSAGNTGFLSELNKVTNNPISGASNSFNVGTIASLSNTAVPVASNVTTTTTSSNNAYAHGTWSKQFVGHNGSNFTSANPDGTMTGSILMGQISTAGEKILWQSNVDVVAGKTYTFSFDYFNSQFAYSTIGHEMGVTVDGQYIQFVTNRNEAGRFTATYVATSTKTITLDINAASYDNGGSGGDFALDNLKFTPSLATNDNTLVAGSVFGGATPNNDTNLAYSDAAITGLAGNDTFTVSHSQLQTKLSAGGYIDGDSGVDTLKLASGTVLDLDRLTRNQTVKAIQEVEIFQLQGGSTLTMSANDVLSLGGSNATTMAGFNFTSTTSGSGTGYNSTGKVQFVVQGTSTDQVKLVPLQLDGVLDAAGEPGNLGLAGQWTSIGLTNIGGVAYQVYNHSTTQAQVLVSNATVQLPTSAQTVAVTSAAISSTSFVQEFVAPQVATTKAQKSVTTDDGNWTISATGANGQTLPTIDANNGNVGYYVSIGERWNGLSGTELNLGEQTTQTLAGGRREYKFTSNTGPFDFVAFNYTDVNFSNDLWINFYNASGQLIDRTAFTAVNVNNSFFTYNIKDAGLATSFMIDTSTDDTWGMDKLTTGVQQSAAEVASGASIMDATPLLKGTYSANLAVGEVIAVYDGATKLGNAVIDANTKTWSYQTTSNLSVAAHTFTAKVETAGGTATSTSSIFSLTLLSSPLALDLNGDGVQTMGIEQGVQFDLLATGSAQNVGWLDGQDGWLALDLDANGRIDSGAELLGSSTRLADGSQARDGWQALAQYDGNADGVIDARDEVFLDLKVWVDANSNGQTEAGELRTLADLQIVSLDLNHAGGEIAQNGNILQGLSSFTTADGQSHEMVDAWLRVDQVLNMADAAEATADAAPAGELLQLNQLLSAAPPAGALIEVLPVLDGSAHNAMLQSMLDLHAQNAAQP